MNAAWQAPQQALNPGLLSVGCLLTYIISLHCVLCYSWHVVLLIGWGNRFLTNSAEERLGNLLVVHCLFPFVWSLTVLSHRSLAWWPMLFVVFMWRLSQWCLLAHIQLCGSSACASLSLSLPLPLYISFDPRCTTLNCSRRPRHGVNCGFCSYSEKSLNFPLKYLLPFLKNNPLRVFLTGWP